MFLFISEPSGRLHNQGELRAPRDPPLVMSISDLDAQAQSHESVGAGTFFTTYEERISLKSIYRESRCGTFTISTDFGEKPAIYLWFISCNFRFDPTNVAKH